MAVQEAETAPTACFHQTEFLFTPCLCEGHPRGIEGLTQIELDTSVGTPTPSEES